MNKNGWSLEKRDPRVIEALMPIWEWFYRYYFRVETDGWHHIPQRGKCLLVGSHNGGIAAPDMHLMMYDWFRKFGTDRLAYGLMHPHVWKLSTPLAEVAEKTGAIVAHPKMAMAAFRQGASVLVYPGGAQDAFRPHSQRDRIYFAGRKGFIKLALREEVPIIPLISSGAHDTLIVLADCYPILKQLNRWGMPWLFDLEPDTWPIYLGLPWGLTFGPFFNIPFPVQIRTRVCPPIIFERYGRKAASDRDYVDLCYERVVSEMQSHLDLL